MLKYCASISIWHFNKYNISIDWNYDKNSRKRTRLSVAYSAARSDFKSDETIYVWRNCAQFEEISGFLYFNSLSRARKFGITSYCTFVSSHQLFFYFNAAFHLYRKCLERKHWYIKKNICAVQAERSTLAKSSEREKSELFKICLSPRHIKPKNPHFGVQPVFRIHRRMRLWWIDYDAHRALYHAALAGTITCCRSLQLRDNNWLYYSLPVYKQQRILW